MPNMEARLSFLALDKYPAVGSGEVRNLPGGWQGRYRYR